VVSLVLQVWNFQYRVETETDRQKFNRVHQSSFVTRITSIETCVMGDEASRLPHANEITLYEVYCLASFVVGYFGVPCLWLKIMSMVDLDNFIWSNCRVSSC
jgi:hypothetical protein